MRHNILGGLVIFVVVVTCLLLLDDISNTHREQSTIAHREQSTTEKVETVKAVEQETPTDLAIIEAEE